MQYRIDKEGLLREIGDWNDFLKRKVKFIACGGTALTLLNVKESTKDIDLLIPRVDEYNYLIKILTDLGYQPVTGSGWSRKGGFIFDLFPGKKIHTTELLESPLKKGNYFPIKEYSHIFLGALNHYDLIISKLFRGTSVDFEDCLALFKKKGNEIDIEKLKKRYSETASYDVSKERVNKQFDSFMGMLKNGEIYNESE